MADLKDILQSEAQRETDEVGCIYLYLEGTFWRAYEWSAWLFTRYVKEFRLTHRQSRNIEQSFVLLGFPATTLVRLEQEGVTVEHLDEKKLLIRVRPDQLAADMDGQNYAEVLEQWKSTIPIVESQTLRKSTKNASSVIPAMQKVSSLHQGQRYALWHSPP